LIGAADDHYLTIGGWVDDAPSNHWSPLFDKPLGEPMADGVYDASTATWRRSFSSGTAVTFNARTNAGTILWATRSGEARIKNDDEAHVRVTVDNAVPRRDTDGNILNSHDGSIVEHDGTFYKYGTVQPDCVGSALCKAAPGHCGWGDNNFSIFSSRMSYARI
jgi:hypothetical protein